MCEPPRCLTSVFLALASLLSVPTARAAPEKADPKKLAESYFGANAGERTHVLEALAPFDAIAAADVEGWRRSLLAVVARGRRVSGKAKATLYEKPERGLYLLAGRKGADALLVALHGGGLGAGDAGQAASAFGGAASSLGMRLVAPEVLEKTEHGWTDPVATERFVLDLIDALVRTEKLDRNRVFLTLVKVEPKGANRFEIAATGPTDGLEILVDARSADLSKEIVVSSGGKEIFRGLAKPSLVTMVRTAERGDPDLPFTASVPAGPR